MKTLVTGAAGFIGFHLCRRLISDGHTVTGVDNLNDYYDPSLKTARLSMLGYRDGVSANEAFKFVRMDIADADAVDNLFEDGGYGPDLGDNEPEEDDVAEEGSGGAEKEAAEEQEPPRRDFNIFLSFPTKEIAEKWLKDRGIDLEYIGMNRNITIRMEGLDYGAGN